MNQLIKYSTNQENLIGTFEKLAPKFENSDKEAYISLCQALATLYLQPNFSLKNEDKAIEYLQRANNEGDVNAALRLFRIFLKKGGDFEAQAIKLLERYPSNRQALSLLGKYYYQTGNIEKSLATLVRIPSNERCLADCELIIKIWVEKNELTNLLRLGYSIYDLLEPELAYKVAVFQISAGEDSSGMYIFKILLRKANASKELKGKICRDFGRLLPGRYSTDKWRKGAEEYENADCMYYLGLAYYAGKEVKKDINKAKDYWEKASNLGCKKAQDELKRLIGEPFEEGKINKERKLENGELILEDKEIEWRIHADKPWHKRAFCWIKTYSGTIAAITSISLLIIAAIGGVVALTIFFPQIIVPILIPGGIVCAGILGIFLMFAAGGH